MSRFKTVKSDKKINYNFLFKCMVGLTAAAVVAAGATALAVKACTASAAVGLMAAAVVTPPFALAALIGCAAFIASICILASVFGSRRAAVYSGTPSVYNRPSWGWGSLFTPAPICTSGTTHVHHGSVFGGGTTHTHGGGIFGGSSHHSHGGGGHSHSHGGVNTHSHGFSHR